MKGINYIVDGRNRRTAMVIDIKLIENNQEALEDLLDVLVAQSSKNDPTISWDEMKKKLRKKGTA